MSTIKLVQGDNRPYIKLTLTNADGDPINLSDVDTTIVVYFKAAASSTVLATLACSKVGDGSTGEVVFGFPGGTLDVPPGNYEGEIEISFGGSIQTVFRPLNFYIREQFD
mgnify:CR=1 FL=1